MLYLLFCVNCYCNFILQRALFCCSVLFQPSAYPLRSSSDKEKTYPNPFSYKIGFGYEWNGGRYRTRTCDLLHVKQMLYQLS